MSHNIMKIAITPEHPAPDEARKISALVADGWLVHLRHPGITSREMSEIIGRIDPRLHAGLALHGHFDLTADFNVGGVHLNSRCPEAPHHFTGRISRSCHSLEEAMNADAALTYVTLSPVFDSISKAGYRSAFTDALLREVAAAPVKVIALGGVTPDRTDAIRSYGFGGYAVLGALPWDKDIDTLLYIAKTFS